MPITKFTERVKDTNIFSFGISFVKRLNLSEIQISQEEPKQEETKNVRPSNNDKISVILINDIIDKPIAKFTEKVKDANIFSLGKRLNLKAYKRLYY